MSNHLGSKYLSDHPETAGRLGGMGWLRADGEGCLVLIKWIKCGVTDREAFGAAQQNWARVGNQPGFLGRAAAGAVAIPKWRTSLHAGPIRPATTGS